MTNKRRKRRKGNEMMKRRKKWTNWEEINPSCVTHIRKSEKNVFGIPMEETEEFEDQRKRLDGNEPVSITT